MPSSTSSRVLSPGLLLIIWIIFVHLAGIYLFTSGFLLTRLALTNVTSCTDGSCTLPATHKRALVLIIDSLRFDFIAPAPFIPPVNSSEYSLHHHSTLTLPSLLTSSHPRNSFIFNSYPDPPTTTLQRIKGLTTGSLPTFVDLGSNFGGSEIQEDSIVGQIGMSGGQAAFMGDDTWMSVFPNAFHVNMTWPYDSFNVEDLHTVDNGVITHLFPLLESNDTPDLVIGHFLGVDHVGHRVGPKHPSMHTKLLQMNATLARVVELLSDDTLLIVLGDHGMDRAGDHGGDGDLETSAGVWLYSKGVELAGENLPNPIPSRLLTHTTFPDAASPHRSIQQIDLVPTLSLLLGLPIPFNNLGAIIPELFWRQSNGDNEESTPEESSRWKWGRGKNDSHDRKSSVPLLNRALRINANQIHTYLDTYRASASGAELDDAWSSLESTWKAVSETEASTRSLQEETEDVLDLWTYTRLALSSCRAMWAQFNALIMVLGLLLLAASLLSTCAIYTGLSRVSSASFALQTTSSAEKPAESAQEDWEDWLFARMWQAVRGFAGGAILGFLASLTYETQLQVLGKGMDSLDCVLFMAPFTSCFMAGTSALPKNYRLSHLVSLTPSLLTCLPLVLHALAFFSNSFTFWEDRVVTFLLASSLLPHILVGIRAHTARLRRRILGFVGLMAVCVRLMAISTVCREEQHPYCHVTFYSSSTSSSAATSTYTSAVVPPSASSSSAPLPALFFAPLIAIALPMILRLFLKQSKSDQGLASIWFIWVMTPSLLCGTGYWLLEYAETTGLIDESEWGAMLRLGRTWFARCALGMPILLGGAIWFNFPLCISVETEERSDGSGARQVKILGFANAYGAPFLLLWTIPFMAVWASTQLTGQISLGLSAIALMAYLETMDGVRDVQAIEDAFASNRLSDMLSSSNDTGDDFGFAAQSQIQTPQIKLSEIVPIALLAMHTFYRTGHQSTIPSIQWKSAFLLSSTVAYPWSPATVILNSFGPMWVIGMGIGLVALWLRAPRFVSLAPSNQNPPSTPSSVSAHNYVQLSALLCSLCISMYFLTLLLTTSLSAAILRRHLMVWKVFAPRWMLGVVGLLVCDVSVLMGYLGMWRVKGMVDKVFTPMMNNRR